MKHYLLIGMILSYLLPIFYVYYYYTCNNSVSNLICSEKYNKPILLCMAIMGIFTILYELDRNDLYSISFILIGIYGLLLYDETFLIHYLFAVIVFIMILFFQIRHCYLTDCKHLLFLSLSISIGTLLSIILNRESDIFTLETIYIVNFAFFYLYVHFLRE